MLSIALYFTIIAIGVVAYLIGHRDGYRKGHDSGFMAGHRHGQRKWIDAMEARRGPDGQDRLVRVVKRDRFGYLGDAEAERTTS